MKIRKTTKLVIVFMLVIITISFPFRALAVDIPPVEEEEKIEYLLDPSTGQYLPVRNREEYFYQRSCQLPKDPAAEEAFLQHVERRVAEQNARNTNASTEPVPSGLGFGFYYTQPFKEDFYYGTSISYDIICPDTAGGNNADWLYLTATNRAFNGVEAYIAYYSQNNLAFKVFDWAKPENERFALTIAYSDLSDYLRTKWIHGSYVQYLTVQHITYYVSGTTWRNVVWLQSNDWTYDLVYSYDYTSSVSEQRTGRHWGPIVETFQDNYSNMNKMGFNATYLRQADSSNVWSSWAFLSPSDSSAYGPFLGFTLDWSDANYGFAVY